MSSRKYLLYMYTHTLLYNTNQTQSSLSDIQEEAISTDDFFTVNLKRLIRVIQCVCIYTILREAQATVYRSYMLHTQKIHLFCS